MGPISTSTILFIDNGPRATSQRERELQSAVVRAHAAKISHQRRKGPRSVDKSRRQRRGTRLAHDAEGPRIEDEKKEDEEDDIVDICGFDTTATDCSEEASPDTRCLTRVGRTTTTNLLWLDQTTRDPFNIEPSRNVSAVIHDLMNYGRFRPSNCNLVYTRLALTTKLLDSLHTNHISAFSSLRLLVPKEHGRRGQEQSEGNYDLQEEAGGSKSRRIPCANLQRGNHGLRGGHG